MAEVPLSDKSDRSDKSDTCPGAPCRVLLGENLRDLFGEMKYLCTFAGR